MSPNTRGKATTDSATEQAAWNLAELKDLVEFFKTLSDETRLKILQYLLIQPEYHVRALCELLKQSQPAVSHHLALLRMGGVIECRRDGKHNFYRIIPGRFKEIRELLTGGKNANTLFGRLFAGHG